MSRTAPHPSRTGDLGNGTYRNPVLAADWSDPDVLRVGEGYYLTASSFGRAPALPLLHSRDLVNWTITGHALDRLRPEAAYASPRPDGGVWAPSLRHHDGRFRLFWGDPDHGIWQVNSPSVHGPWSTPHLVKAGLGLIDPCPLWDEETGEAYLVHAWAKSRSGVSNRLTGHRMSPDGERLLDEGTVIVDADRIPGWFTLEGPKLYRHDGWFWIVAPAGGVATGWQGAFRSRSFFGPYEERVVLQQGDTDVNGPHQGGWVRTQNGEDWFLHFQQRGAHGRLVHLQPMRWGADGWPVLGRAGSPVRVHTKPDLPRQPLSSPAGDDAFPGGRFGEQWQWTANPVDGWTTRHSGDGLRLNCVRTERVEDLRALPHLLTQRMPARACTVEVDLRLDSSVPGARAGLVVLGEAYGWIGLERDTDGRDGPVSPDSRDSPVRLVHRFAPANAGRERDAARCRPAPEGRARLRIELTADARCRFSFDTGSGFTPSGEVFAATPWKWVGALLGLFAAVPPRTGHGDSDSDGPGGTAVFTAFRITPGHTPHST